MLNSSIQIVAENIVELADNSFFLSSLVLSLEQMVGL